MADLSCHGNNPDRDVEQAIVALKKGTQLIKYSRKGRPKFCPFRISADETSIIWYSRGEERNLNLSKVSKIIPGQRTAVFRRYLRPEKDYLSFSLLYNNGDRSLDLICKDKAEADLWFVGLTRLIPSGQQRSKPTKTDFFDQQEGSDSVPTGSPILDFASIANGGLSIDSDSRESRLSSSSSDVASYRPSMQLRTSTTDGFRISVSSTPSCSSGGSGTDDAESLGDVYLWGEIWLDGASPDGSPPIKSDVLTPKPLESSVVLDVHQISCGVRHVALVTRQGEVFTWGEESGGRLGHGVERDFARPHLVEFLAVNNVDSVACGEFHSCAVSASGDLFTWGDGAHNAGLLGHGTDVSHWIPKRVNGSVDGLQVLSVACGTWHTALTTLTGKLFTFGDGKFGALGHGDRASVRCPKEIQSLGSLRTVKVACGVWHTAAIVELAGQPGSTVSSRKLFTWGDGDKYRLGHGSKETYLVPTCVSSLLDYNFHQIGCGRGITVALTTSGHVFTMGGTAHGQLGKPSSDGKSPCLVQDKLVGEFVEEISCGASHVAVLTSRNEVFTWGKGGNGRLGHGDTEDRKTPTLVETLRDRTVKNISCGSNFTTSICIHKWVSGADQSVCSGCRQAFGFTRKRHNCYNCGLVHCHACSSKKAFRAALAPTPGKPHRVCDACYAKLKAAEAGNGANYSRKQTNPRRSSDSREYLSTGEARSSRILLSPSRARSHYAVTAKTPTSPRISASSRQSTATFASRPSPPRSVTPVFSRNVVENMKKSNELLTQDLAKLHTQVKSLKQKIDAQDLEMQKLTKEARSATLFAEDQSSRCRIAAEFVKSFAGHSNAIIEKLPPEDAEAEFLRSLHDQAEDFLYTTSETSESSSFQTSSDRNRASSARSNPDPSRRDNDGQPSSEDGSSKPREHSATTTPRSETGREAVEQFEPGVYVTVVLLQDGAKMFRRVKFSKRRFSEQQAEEWWNTNKERLLKHYSAQRWAGVGHAGSPTASSPADGNSQAESSP